MFCYGYYLGEALLQSDLQDVALVEVKPRDTGRHLAEGCDYDSVHGPWGPNYVQLWACKISNF